MLQEDSHSSKAAAVQKTWATRCDCVWFVSDKLDPALPILPVILTGRDKLWGKTKVLALCQIKKP